MGGLPLQIQRSIILPSLKFASNTIKSNKKIIIKKKYRPIGAFTFCSDLFIILLIKNLNIKKIWKGRKLNIPKTKATTPKS